MQRTESRGREMKVNMKGVMAFLANPFNNDAIVETIDMVDLTERASKKYSSPFLMLTRGGLEMIDQLAAELLAEGKSTISAPNSELY